MEQLLHLCKQLQLTQVGSDLKAACEQAQRQQLTHEAFLYELLLSEQEQRLAKRTQRRIKEAKFPRIKTLDSFDFRRSPHLPEVRIRQLAQGNYIAHAEPIILIGEPGTGKTHLASALGYGAAQQGKRVYFTTASSLVNQLNEARDQRTLGRLTQQYQRYELLILDEIGYLPLTKVDAELLFQVLSQRHEKASLIITTNLSFSEWTAIFPDPRLCKALIDRLTHRAHIIETGTESIRFAETLAQLHHTKPGG